MDINSLFSPSLILHSLTVGIAVYIIRIWLESKFSQLINNKLYTGVLLPTLALVLSVGISLLLPDPTGTPADRIQLAILAGFSSSYLFSALKAVLKAQAGSGSIPPKA